MTPGVKLVRVVLIYGCLLRWSASLDVSHHRDKDNSHQTTSRAQVPDSNAEQTMNPTVSNSEPESEIQDAIESVQESVPAVHRESGEDHQDISELGSVQEDLEQSVSTSINQFTSQDSLHEQDDIKHDSEVDLSKTNRDNELEAPGDASVDPGVLDLSGDRTASNVRVSDSKVDDQGTRDKEQTDHDQEQGEPHHLRQQGEQQQNSNNMDYENSKRDRLQQPPVNKNGVGKGGSVTVRLHGDPLDVIQKVDGIGNQQEQSSGMNRGTDRGGVGSDDEQKDASSEVLEGEDVGEGNEQNLEQSIGTDSTLNGGTTDRGTEAGEKEGNGEDEVENDADGRETHGGSLVLEEIKDDIYQEGMELVAKMDPQSKLEGYRLVKEAAEHGHTKAQEQLAYAHMFGSVLERNFTRSYEIFSQLAENGNPIGQQGLAFMYSSGIGVNSSQAKALLYYTFAALGGHYFAQMTMGYRSLMGISVAQSCEAALSYYHKAAKKVVDEVTLITGGLLISKVRLMEEDNEATNVYGVSEDDMIHYHNVFADSGNTGAQVLLGVYYMFGMAGAERNFEMAMKFLVGAAKEGFSAANALIGKIYAEGSPEVPQDYDAAMNYFRKARQMGHADGYSGMGMLYLYGMGVEKDYASALEYFQKAADKGSAEAQYYLGHMFYEGIGTQRNINKALRYFQLASHGGHILAIYYLGEMHAEGTAVKRNCNYAVELFKGVAERGKWTRVLEEAERSYMVGDLNSALMVYLLLAEMGLEVAQTNAAYILEQDGVTLVHEKETLKRALILWNRSASQGEKLCRIFPPLCDSTAATGYSMARVKLGDYYYYGQGTDLNYEAAASQYRIASDKQSSAQAMFNLAYMYQQGYGLQKDYHLAKRYYDLAAETSGEAHVPVVLALMRLDLQYYYDSYVEVMASPMVTHALAEVEGVTGENWDIYLITLLSGLLVLVVMWRWRY